MVTLEKTVIDCPDPQQLAAFYAAILNMRINEDSPDWVVIGMSEGQRQLAFQRDTAGAPSAWPDPSRPQQLHLDLRVDDIEQSQKDVLALGARLLDDTPGRGFRVFADPAGHPFCLLF